MASFFSGNRRQIIIFSILFILLITLLCGCDSLKYYSQGISGHFKLMAKVQPINDVLLLKSTPTDTRKLLNTALHARAFAIHHLKLPNNQSYRGYADLNRKRVTWNVIATPPLSMKPYLSCFPITGCLSYRGYFNEMDAKKFASQLQEKKYETYIGGSTAYSTLGWFHDPIVSPMLQYGEARLVETLFHELAHQQLYIKDDSDFNEAFATTVGENGTREWLKQTHPDKLQRYTDFLRHYHAFLSLLNRTSQRLKSTYEGDQNDAFKLSRKQHIIHQLKLDYQLFKQQHDDYSGFDKWFEKPINNPRLAIVSVYHELVPDFERWLNACHNDYSRFYDKIEIISKLPKNKRMIALKKAANCT